MITLSKPKKLNKTSNYPTKGSNPYNLSQMNSDDFAKLTYWLYRTEIEEGKWSKEFDDIAIMKATRDAGRDCVLYKSGVMKGVIQCKHSVNTALMSVDAFLIEFTKFILYSIEFPEKVKLGNNFKYYVAISGGFSEDCINLINDFKAKISIHTNLQKHAEKNIAEYKSLNHYVYSNIEQQFLTAISFVQVKMITGVDMNKLLHQPQHQSSVKAFFDSKYVLDEKTAQILKKRTKKIEKKVSIIDKTLSPKSKKRPQQIQKPEPHIPRNVATPDDSIIDAFNEKEVSLVDSILRYQYVAFLGWGLSGKSIEMTYAAHELSSDNYSYHVFFFSMGLYKGQDIDLLISDINLRPSQQIILFLDGLDEVQPEFYNSAILSIRDFKARYPDIRLVVSCRNNAYLDEEDTEHSTLPGFTVIKIRELSHNSRYNYLKALSKFDFEDFNKKMEVSNLESLLGTPYYLIKFANQFIASGRIFKNKGELFEETIEQGIKDDIKKYYLTGRKEKQKTLRSALDKLAFVMELRGQNFFTSEELEAIFVNKEEDLLLITQNGKLIEGDIAKGTWKLFHHNVQEYLTAKVLSSSNFSEIKDLVTVDDKNELIRPSLVNTISFLIGMLPKDSELRKQMIDLLTKSEPALFMKFEADYLNDDLRINIFKKIFEYYKATQRPINMRKFELRDLASFSQVKTNIGYLINELKNSNTENDKFNALDILMFYDFTDFPLQSYELENLLVLMLNTANDGVKFKIIKLLTNHFDYDQKSFRFIFDDLKDNPNTHLRAMLFWSINRFNLEFEYCDFILNQAEFLVIEEHNSSTSEGSVSRSGTEYEMIKECLGKLDDLLSIKLKVVLIKDHFNAFRYSISLCEVISSVLKQAEKYSSEKSIIDPIIDIYIAGLKSSSIDTAANDMWIVYFRSTNQLLNVCKRLIADFGGIVYINAKALAHICDQDCLTYLASEVSNKNISIEHAESFQWYIRNQAPEMVKAFNLAVDDSISLALPEEIDFKKIEEDKLELELRCIFKHQSFIDEVGELFTKSGKVSLSYKDLELVQTDDRVMGQFYYWLFNSFDYKSGDREYTLQEVLTFESNRSSELMPSRIYDLIKGKSSIKLSVEQIDQVRNWCLLVEDNLDFEKDEIMSNYRIMKYSDEILFAYFARRFEFDGFKTKTYLNMLSHYDGSSSGDKIHQFIMSFVKPSLVTKKILRNLIDGKIRGMVLLDHVEYVMKFQCNGAAEPLLDYLKKRHVYNWAKVLDGYLAVGGSSDELYQLLPTIEDSNLYSLVNVLLEIDPAKLYIGLKDLFNNQSDDRKLVLTKYLVRLGDIDAFEYYVDVIKNSAKVPDILSIHSPIQVSFSEPFAKTCLSLFEYTFAKRLDFDMMNNPFSIAVNIFRSMATDYPNFQNFKVAINNYLNDLKLRQPTYFDEISSSLESFLEDWDHNFMLNSTSIISIEEAIQHFDSIKRLIR